MLLYLGLGTVLCCVGPISQLFNFCSADWCFGDTIHVAIIATCHSVLYSKVTYAIVF